MANASKQIPITWGTKDSSGWYTGTFNIQSIPAGSGIQYAYGWLSSTATANKQLYSLTVNCELWQDNEKWEKEYTRNVTVAQGGGVHWSFAIDESFAPSNIYKIKLKNSSNNLDDFIPSTLDFYMAKPMANVTDVVLTGNKMYRDVIVDFNLTSNDLVHYNVKMSDEVLLTGTTRDRQIIIPAGTIENTGELTVELYSTTEYWDETFTSDVATATTTIQPLVVEKPTEFRLMGGKVIIEQDSLFQWETVDTDLESKMEIWQEGKVILTVNHITGNQYILKGGTLTKTSPLTLRVSTIIDNDGYFLESAYTELKQSTLESIKPVITDFALESNNVDYDITINPTSTNCESYQVKLGNRVITNTLTIPKDTLNAGLNELTLIGINSSVTGTLTKEFTLIQDEPVVYTIEPNNISVNIDMLSNITFTTNSFIDSFRMYINGDLFYSGTSERKIIISNNTFVKGNNTIKVIATYRNSRTTTKEVTFPGYGRPSVPTLNLQDMYDTANPTLDWESEEQTGYEIYVGEDEHSTITDTATEYTVDEALTNNSTYTVKLRVKNSYELWSDWVQGAFKTLWADIDKPELILSQQGSNVLLQVSCLIEDFKEMDIYKYDHRNKSWIIYANDLSVTDNLTDYLVVPNQEERYKARVYNSDGIYNESEIKTITVSNMKNYNIVNLLDLENNKRLDYVSINFTHVGNTVSKIFSGQSKPRIFKSNTSYYTANMTVKLENTEVEDFIQYIQNGKVFCYRDYKGKKIYASIDVKAVNYINPFMQEIILTLTEVSFNEYLSGNKGESASFIYLNGQYYLDGSIDLRGWN